MEIFFRKHTEEFLMAFAVVLIGFTIGCFVWGMIYASENLDNVFTSKPVVGQTIGFNLSGAQKLDLRGLAPQQ